IGRVVFAATALTLAGSLLTDVASAAPITVRADEHFTDALSPIVSAACGFQVIGVIDVTEIDIAVPNPAGDVFRELNLSAHGTETVTAASSGKSITFPVVLSFHYSYPDGNDIGDRAIVTIDGFVRKLPGAHAEAGRVIYGNGVIASVDANGFPRVLF